MILTGFLCLSFTTFLFAHGDLHEQIERTSKRIEKQPDNAELYLKRGQLYAQHDEFENARKDFLKARELNPDLTITDLLLAKVYAENQKPYEALPYSNTFLKNHPNDANGLIIRAGIFQQLKNNDAAKADLEKAFDNIESPNPGHFIAIAEAHHSDFETALNWLQKGQKKFGFDIVLKEKEVEILVENRKYDRAILTVNEILERLPRKEIWLFEKGEIYEKAQNQEAALTNYKMALKAVQDLPKRIQGTRKMMELEARVLEKIESLSK